MHSSLRRWLQISLFNLMLVGAIGVILRYKIAFSLPWIDQKYLLHGHSHFAFAGWISQALMTLMVASLSEKSGTDYFRRFRGVLYANLFTAYGMLFTFPFEGYGFLSISFSTLSVFVSWTFAFCYWRQLRVVAVKEPGSNWFKVALLCNVISSIGPFTLAYMMATKHIHENWYLASLYFFLHFQYNGWFFFAGMGLLAGQLKRLGLATSKLRFIFRLFALACVPTLFLSLLWWPVPQWLLIIVAIAAVAQLLGFYFLLRLLRPYFRNRTGKLFRLEPVLWFLTGLALTLKLLLQAGSVIPSLSKLAFGFRPIVIGYLHLVLLGVITIFIFAFILSRRYLVLPVSARIGLKVFVAGILFNEFMLMAEGIADLYYQGIPAAPVFLLIAAATMFAGLALLNLGIGSKPGIVANNNQSRSETVTVPAK